MHRILTFFLGLHWMAHFALLAIWATGSGNPPASNWLDAVGPDGANGGMAMVVTLGFALTAVLFLWMLVAVLLDRRMSEEADDVARLAFAAGTGILTLVLLADLQPTTGLMPAVSLQLGALLVSYVAICAERRSFIDRASFKDDAEAGASSMALGAAHNAMLSRFSARPGAEG